MQARERRMWCVVQPAQADPIGALVIRLVHDHTQLRLPRPPGILALEQTETPAIVQAITRAARQRLDIEE